MALWRFISLVIVYLLLCSKYETIDFYIGLGLILFSVVLDFCLEKHAFYVKPKSIVSQRKNLLFYICARCTFLNERKTTCMQRYELKNTFLFLICKVLSCNSLYILLPKLIMYAYETNSMLIMYIPTAFDLNRPAALFTIQIHTLLAVSLSLYMQKFVIPVSSTVHIKFMSVYSFTYLLNSVLLSEILLYYRLTTIPFRTRLVIEHALLTFLFFMKPNNCCPGNDQQFECFSSCLLSKSSSRHIPVQSPFANNLLSFTSILNLLQ